MRSHQNEILEKMKDNSYGELNFDFAYNLTNESDRGGVLIGTSKVEDHLEKLLLLIIPKKTKAYKSRLFDYPGSLSSFSGKIELLYAFRIIDNALYNALTALRKIRNKAAHSANSFALKNVEGEINLVYQFEENFGYVIKHLAYNNFIKFKLIQIKEAFEEKEFESYDYEKIFKKLYPDPLENESIVKQLRVWQLSYTMTFLCLKIQAVTDDYVNLKNDYLTWADITLSSNSAAIVATTSN